MREYALDGTRVSRCQPAFFVLTDHSNWRVSNLIEKRKSMVYYGSSGRCEESLKFDHLEGVRWQEQQLIWWRNLRDSAHT